MISSKVCRKMDEVDDIIIIYIASKTSTFRQKIMGVLIFRGAYFLIGGIDFLYGVLFFRGTNNWVVSRRETNQHGV